MTKPNIVSWKKKKKLDTKGMFLNIIKAIYNKPTADTTTVKG